MNAFAQRHGTAVIALLAAGLVAYAAFLAPVALKLIDEAIYYAAAWSLAERGSLIVENGWDRFEGALPLRMQFLVPGPNGLAPQYPPGAAAIGAPLLELFGMRGLVLANAVAAAVTLFVTRALALRAFGRADMALSAVLLLALGTFWAEYAFGIWPHTISVLCVVTALWCFLRGLDADTPRALVGWAVAAGAATGAGMLVRADTVLILPALAVAAIWFAPRPVAALGAGLAGLAPFLAVAAAVNAFKFGRWNPFTYGADGGGVELSGHVGALLVMGLALAAMGAARATGWRPVRWQIAAGAGAAALAALLVPPVRDLVASYAEGFHGLIVDAKQLDNVELNERNGVVYFWNVPKTALGQSLPWIGCLVAALFLPLTARERRATGLFAIAVGFWTLPFILLAWHGGYANNMRYFLPILPVLAILGAWLWHRLADMTGAAWLIFAIAGVYGVGLVALWSVLHDSGFDGAEQIMATFVLTGSAGVALLAGWAARRVPRMAIATQFMFALGVSLAFLFGGQDVRVDKAGRAMIARAVDTFGDIPERSIYYGRPELFPGFVARPDSFLTMPSLSYRHDAEFLQEAMNRGYNVFLEPEHLRAMIELIPGARPTPEIYYSGYFVFHQLAPPARDGAAAPPAGGDDARD